MFKRRQYINGISVGTIVCVVVLISQLPYDLNQTVTGLETTTLAVDSTLDRFGQGLRETCVKQNVLNIRSTITRAKYWRVQGFTWSGHVISVDIRAFTATKKSQTKGGDVFLVRAVQP